MFLPRDERSTPPRWEPPRRLPARTTGDDRKTFFIAVVVVIALFGPELAGTFYMLTRALMGY